MKSYKQFAEGTIQPNGTDKIDPACVEVAPKKKTEKEMEDQQNESFTFDSAAMAKQELADAKNRKHRKRGKVANLLRKLGMREGLDISTEDNKEGTHMNDKEVVQIDELTTGLLMRYKGGVGKKLLNPETRDAAQASPQHQVGVRRANKRIVKNEHEKNFGKRNEEVELTAEAAVVDKAKTAAAARSKSDSPGFQAYLAAQRKKRAEAAASKPATPPAVKEEVEQIDEISAETEHSYFKARYAQQPDRTKRSKKVRQGMDRVTNRALKRNTMSTAGASQDFADQEKKRGVGHVRDHVELEGNQLDERNQENALKRKSMDASRGARYKAAGNPVPEAGAEHKTAQQHNKAIGRALRNEGTKSLREFIETLSEAKPVNVDKVNAAGQAPHEEKWENAKKPAVKKESFTADQLLVALKEGMWPGTPEYKAKFENQAKQGGGSGVKKGSRYGGSLQKPDNDNDSDDAKPETKKNK